MVGTIFSQALIQINIWCTCECHAGVYYGTEYSDMFMVMEEHNTQYNCEAYVFLTMELCGTAEYKFWLKRLYLQVRKKKRSTNNGLFRM